MAHVKHLAVLVVLCISCTASVVLSADVANEKPSSLKDVYGPVVVGRPPVSAYCGLVKLDSGELRHYLGRDAEKKIYTYISSKDNGLTWTTLPIKNSPYHWAAVKSPVSKEYVRLATHDNSVYCARSKGGFNGKWTFAKIWSEKFIMLKPPVFVRAGKRMLVGCHSTKRIGCGTFYSDDDGLTWKLSTFTKAPHHKSGGLHNGRRWNHGAVEPTVVELKDGRVWMLIRTAQDNHYESFSKDGGQTWSKAKPSRFYGTITMPTINRLKDGRLLFLWNNTTPLPEMNNPNGNWEDVFTNRDALHAAVSEDEGKTWIGYRELILNADRNRGDFASCAKRDMSVHQTQIAELPAGKILVSLGQGVSRRLLIFDPKWLYETKHSVDFAKGLDSVTTHQYLKGIKGHCAFDRIRGAELLTDRDSKTKSVRICNPMNKRLVIPNQGLVWNFPNAGSAKLTVKIKFPKGSKGGRISLLDRWVNASDKWSHNYAMYNLNLDSSLAIGKKAGFTPGKWHELRFEWPNVTGAKKGASFCTAYLDDVKLAAKLPLARETANGISYIHFISSDEADPHGLLLSNVSLVHTNANRK